MVVDPSPRCVGLEFVRQYYTVLNKAPTCLHRFYSNDSKFLHSGEVVMGQNEIHKKILSLGFNDCHAKIQLVDAFSTLGEGVLIQVTGELSNNGMPMRKFTQSIVLAPQSPKKYYVHSDIFHYIDELFNINEEATLDEGVIEEIDDLEINSTSEDNFIGKPINGNILEQPDIQPEVVPENHYCVPPVVQSAVQKNPPPAVSPIPHAMPLMSETIPRTANSVQEDLSNDATVQNEWISESPPLKTTPVKEEKPKLVALEESKPAPRPVVSNEPKTYANLLKNKSSFPSSTVQSVTTNQPAEQTAAVAAPVTNHVSKPRSEPRAFSKPLVNDSAAPTYQKPIKHFQEEDRRRFVMPDTHQIFVGNLPHTISEDELKAAFREFGKVVDVRINTAKGKISTKGSSHSVPNFGFISFEQEDSVQKCLDARPIYLNGESRINVEEKKARNNGSHMPPRPGGRGGALRGGMSQGPRGGGIRGGFSRENRGGRGSFTQRR